MHRLARGGVETAAMLLWALLASGQITLCRVDGWPTSITHPPRLT